MVLRVVLMMIGALVSAAESSWAEDTRPNIVLILADDVGFTDFGAYGSEIRTPNIDALARDGVIFSNFHVSPICAPSRAMLMTGVDSHLAGMGNLPESAPKEHKGKPGYLGELAPDVVTIASLLQRSGYHTYMAGKWHLGHSQINMPTQRGFEHAYHFDATGADNYEARTYLPVLKETVWYDDGVPTDLPEDFYSSKDLVDRTIDHIDQDREDGKPFFSYLPFMAAHIPVQAPKEFVDRYDGVYDDGWQEQRQRRFNAAKEKGLIPEGAKLSELPPGQRQWDAQSAEDKAMLAKSMAVNAGMIEAMDYHIGRLVAYLAGTGELANTVFIVLSDNGAEPSNPLDRVTLGIWLKMVGYSRDIETLGEKGSYAFIGPEFASAASAPGSFFKFYAGEGGMRVPLIVSGGIDVKSQTTDALSYITDIPRTILDIAQVAPPDQPAKPMSGRSLIPLLEGTSETIYAPDETFAVEAGGGAALFQGPYKLVRNIPPLSDGEWKLFNIALDPGETNNLAVSSPALFAQMQDSYALWADSVGVMEVPEGYDQLDQIARNGLGILARAFMLPILGLLGLIALFIWLWRRKRA